MLFLIASMVALVAGPLALALLGKREAPLAFLDGFVVVALGGLVLLHLLPSSLQLGGPLAAVAALVGVLLPGLLERGFTKSAEALHSSLLVAAMGGLAVHAMLDGAAIASDHAHHGHHGEGLLATGVLLHRVPVGLTIWWAVRPERGRAAASLVLAVVLVATVVGFAGAEPLLEALPTRWLACFEALVAGTLMHVAVGHQPHDLRRALEHHNHIAAAGAAAGAASLAFIAHAHPLEGTLGYEISALSTFLTLASRLAPPLLAALVVSALWTTGRARPRSIAGGTLFGMLSAGEPSALASSRERPLAPAAVARFAASTGLGLDALLMSLPLLGHHLLAARAAAVALAAAVVGRAVGRSDGEDASEPAAAHRPASPRARWAQAAESFEASVERVAPWLLIALTVAALLEPLMPAHWLAGMPAEAQVVVLALAGLPGPLTAGAATPIAVILLHKGVSAGAVLAFLVSGPTANLAVLAALGRRQGRRRGLAYALLVTAVAIASGLLVDGWSTPDPLPLHEAAERAPSWFEILALTILAAMSIRALIRRGPRALLAHVFETHAPAHHHHHESPSGA